MCLDGGTRLALEPTFHFQVKGAAVELVLVADLTPVIARVVLLGLDDLHLKCVDLSEETRIDRVRERLVLSDGRSGQNSYLGVAFEGLFELQVLPCLAGQVHPFSLEPLDGGFAQKVFCFYFGDKGDVPTFRAQPK